MLAEMAQSHYDLVQGSFVISVNAFVISVNVNEENQTDQSMFYSGAKAQHGYQVMAAFFPNGITALSDPFYGKTHDSKLLRLTGWLPLLRAAASDTGRPFTVFGDAAFGVSDRVQCMVKGV